VHEKDSIVTESKSLSCDQAQFVCNSYCIYYLLLFIFH